MIGTVEEAKKWECPLTFSGNNGSGWCIADQCAAWRWRLALNAVPSSTMLFPPKSDKGYCGAFGRPEAE